jgi:Kef-type K+ transport system membrane component KefB
LTRLPPGHPIAPSQNAPIVQFGIGLSLMLLLGGLKFQLRRLRKMGSKQGARSSR